MRFSNLNDWLDWQSRLHIKSIDLGLERAAAVWQRLHPQNLSAFVITVAGTNGKGSSVAMLESILLAAGYSVGCYTSPHLVRYNERIRLNGGEADDTLICEAFEKVDQHRQAISLSYFEFGTLAALTIFSEANVDVILLEVGLGGRLDAVNIIDADAALISSIGIDHADWLGDNREDIGQEKAGILRNQQPAVFAGRDIPQSVVEHASRTGTNLLVAGQNYRVETINNGWNFISAMGNRNALPLPALRGSHQVENAAGVVALLAACYERLPVSVSDIRQGLLSAQVRGRFQVIQGEFPVIVDVAHNEQSMQSLSDSIASFPVSGQLHVIIGMLKDKAVTACLNPLLSQADSWHFVNTPGERGQTALALSETVSDLTAGRPHFLYENVSDAYDSVLHYARAGDAILVTGSFLIAGQFLETVTDQTIVNTIDN